MISKILRIWLLQDMELNLSSGQREYKLRMQNQQTKTKASNNKQHLPPPKTHIATKDEYLLGICFCHYTRYFTKRK